MRIFAPDKTSMDIYQLVKSHARNHCGVADRLQLHVSAVLCSFQFYDYEVSLAIDVIEAEQIDPAVTVLPFTKLFCYDHQVGGKDRDIGLYKTLQVAPLKQLLLGEGGL